MHPKVAPGGREIADFGDFRPLAGLLLRGGFSRDTIVNCRKYTPDFYSHGTALSKFKEQYFDLLCEGLPSEIKRQLFGLFLPSDQGVDRHVGGFFLSSVDAEGCYHERYIEVENKYL